MTDQHNSRNDEIDLIELFRIIGKKISQLVLWIVRSFLLIITFFIRNALILLLFIIIGGLIGFAKYKISKPYYSSEMVVRTNALNASDFVNYINRLHNLAMDQNRSELSRLLNINDTTVKQIKDIQAFNIVDVNKDGIGDYVDYKNDFNIKDTSQQIIRNRAVVSVNIYQQSEFNLMQMGLHNYMVSSPWVNQVNENRIERFKELIDQIDHQITKLDSLENYEYFEKDQTIPVKDGQIVFMNPPEVKLYHQDILHLYQQRQNYQQELTIYHDPITVIENFTPLIQAANPLSKYLKTFIVIFVVMGIVLVFIKEQYSNIKKIVNNQPQKKES